MKEKYDAIVVGASFAGLVFSCKLAEQGFRVLVIEKEPAQRVGCDYLVEDALFRIPGFEFTSDLRNYSGAPQLIMISPDMRTQISISELPMGMINARELSETLFDRAKSSGVEVRMGCSAFGVEIENGFVVGVKTSQGNFPSRIAVCASGAERVLCRDIPIGMGIPRQVGLNDRMTIYREVRNVSSFGGSVDELKDGVLEYYVGRYGGFCWVFRRGSESIDIGVATHAALGNSNPREIARGFIRSNPIVGDRILFSGGGSIPTRRPLNTMVGSGFMALGDSACHANPIFAKGIAGAMLGASIASDAAALALETGDVGVEGLWSYNYEYMRQRGSTMVDLDALRIFLHAIGEEDFSWLMAKGLLGEEELAKALSGRTVFSGDSAGVRGRLKALGNFPLARRYSRALRFAQRAQELYGQYPSSYYPPEFSEWSQEADFLFANIRKVLST
ncbi:MAG: FAD-binding protein [Actinomycetota bacterium]|nr:FAD-binding protein [Actinomycetota bacterium]